MILRKQKIAALLILLPVLSSAVVVDVDGNGVQKVREKDTAAITNKLEVGTKDAPVDGLDGKPHAGPFVVENTKEKPAKGSKSYESLSDTITVDRKEASSELLSEKDIGVMDDPDRTSPKKGTTGTEGGVSQRTKQDKTEAVKGEKPGKVPVAPDEERPLSNDEQERMGVNSADEEDDELASALEKAKGAAGLAVGNPIARICTKLQIEYLLTISCIRNPQTSPSHHTAIAFPLNLSFRACPRTPTILPIPPLQRHQQPPEKLTVRTASSSRSTRSCCPS